MNQRKDKLYDKKGREIMIFDLLKVFHFVGSRKKKYYMYKQVKEVIFLGENKCQFFKIHHLENDNPQSYYVEKIDGRILKDYEIVQGYGLNSSFYYEDREKCI